METSRFDHLAKMLSSGGTRRSALRLLATLPVVSGLVALLNPDDVDAKGRRRRRKKAHKHGRPRTHGTRKKKPCKPNALAKTCAGKCGSVKNNCQKTVDCGSCACDPPCAVCFTCQEGPNTPGTCVIDPDQQGQECGDPGQVCQADGTCACDAGSCDGSGCCDGNTCVDGTDYSACGAGGAVCVACSGTTPICEAGACVPCTLARSCPNGGCCTDDGGCAGCGA